MFAGSDWCEVRELCVSFVRRDAARDCQKGNQIEWNRNFITTYVVTTSEGMNQKARSCVLASGQSGQTFACADTDAVQIQILCRYVTVCAADDEWGSDHVLNDSRDLSRSDVLFLCGFSVMRIWSLLRRPCPKKEK